MIRAKTEADVAQAVSAAAEASQPLQIQGLGSRAALYGGAPVGPRLDVSALSGVSLYEPNELVLTAAAATPLKTLQALIAARGQHLAFEPPDFGPLWGQAAGGGTIGGLLSVGFGGPRRPRAGAPRDHVLGFRAVNGFGEAFAGGGRVVKNVTGFDLSKLMTGAHGTLGVLTEATLKVMPRPETTLSVCLQGLADADALAMLQEAAASPLPITAGAFAPLAVSEALGLRGASALILRFEGVAPAVAAALTAFEARAGRPFARLADGDFPDLWAAIGGGWAFAASSTPAVFRISCPRSAAGAVAAALRALGVGGYYYDWFGALIVTLGTPAPDGGARAIRERLGAIAPDAHATLIRGRGDLEDPPPVFHPPSAGVARLSRRIKAQFDPAGVLNPGRWAGVF